MKSEQKKYILDNMNRKNPEQIAGELNIRPREVRRLIKRAKSRSVSSALPGETMSLAQDKNKFYWFALVIIAISGISAYSNTFFSTFHFDDFRTIVNNPSVRNIYNLGDIWNFWPNRFITFVSLALNYRWGGLGVFGYHLFNFLLHLGSAILVWYFTILTLNTPLMQKESIAAYAKLISLFAGTVFLLHPIQTQPVNYIIQRATLLAVFFYMASLSLYVKARLRDKNTPGSGIGKVYYIGSLLSAILSMFSKEMAISLPLTICLYELCFIKTKEHFGLKYVIPFLAIIPVIPLTMFLTKSVDVFGMHRISEDSPGISSGHYFLTQLRVMVTYLRLAILPLNQNLDYDYPVAKSMLDIPVVSSLLFLLLILVSAFRFFDKFKLAAFGIFWFFITLLPESSVIPIKDVIFEHRLYLPIVGFSLFLPSGLYYLLKERSVKFTVIILSFLIVGYSVMTYQRNRVWKDEFTLLSDTIKKSPYKARPYNDLGYAYHIKGELNLALSHYSKAIEIAPNLAGTYFNRGLVYQLKGELNLALSDYNKAIEIKPNYAEAYYNRAVVYFSNQEYARSWEDIHKAQVLGLKVRPDFVEHLKKVSGREE